MIGKTVKFIAKIERLKELKEKCGESITYIEW